MDAMIPTGEEPVVVRTGKVAEPEVRGDELLVAVEAFSVNRGETFLLETPRPGWRPGKDVAGTVLQAAANGGGPSVGTRVVGHPESHGWAERAAVPVTNVAALPERVPTVTAAALPLAGLTAIRLLRRAGSLIGRRLLITGASGGVGHYLVELAAAAGAEVTAVSRSTQRGARLIELGAARVVGDVTEAAGPFDVVMESVGGDTFRAALATVKPEGLLLWFGQAGRTPVTVDFFSFFRGPVQARIEQFDYTRSDRTVGEDLATLVDLVDTGRLHPEIGLVRPWTATADVIADLRARRIRGNAVLTVDTTQE